MPDEPMRFGPIVIRPAERTISVGGRPVDVGARAFDVLLALAARRDRLVTRDELLDLVWPGVIVEEHNVTAQVSTLRRLLGPHVIATVPGRGYRFVAAVDEVPARDPDATATQCHNLPAMRTRFVGRDAEKAEIGRLLAHNRLLTLTGIGGSGKTRLAVEYARQATAGSFDDVWFVDLAPLTTDARVAHACASALGVADEGDAALPDRLASRVAIRRTLVVLDNCEHVRPGAAAVVDALLSGNDATTRVLATSREPLGVAGEQRLALLPLPLPSSDDVHEVSEADAVRLFVDRARLASPDFDVDAENAAAIAQICRRLDGIAFAIELAAARVPMLSVADIASRLDDRFRLLARGNSGVSRQRTLAATMQWSYDQLDATEQRVLRLLSVFAGGCSLEALAAIAGSADEYEALGLLTALYDKSLLVIERGVDASLASRPRYAVLETVRQYARERLDERDEGDAARTRHAEYFLRLAETAAPELVGPRQSQWMEVLGLEHENLVAAMSHCLDARASADPSWALRLAAATGRYWLFNEIELGCRLSLAALQRHRGGGHDAARFDTLRGLAGMYMHRGQGAAGLPHAREALALARQAGNAQWQAMAYNVMGTCLSRASDDAAALEHYERARDLAQSSGDVATLSAAVNNIANVDFAHGRLDEAQRGFSQALRLAREARNVRSSLIYLDNLIRTTVASKRFADALAHATEAERLLRDVGEDALKLELLEVAAALASGRGQHAIAARWWGFACPRFLDEGYRRPPEDEAALRRSLSASRDALGHEAFERNQTTGRTLDIASAMRELRAWLEAAARPGDGSRPARARPRPEPGNRV